MWSRTQDMPSGPWLFKCNILAQTNRVLVEKTDAMALEVRYNSHKAAVSDTFWQYLASESCDWLRYLHCCNTTMQLLWKDATLEYGSYYRQYVQ